MKKLPYWCKIKSILVGMVIILLTLSHAKAAQSIFVWGLKGDKGENNRIYFREGVSLENPVGDSWAELPEGTTAHVAASPNGSAWLIDKDGLLWFVPNREALPSKNEWTKFETGWADISVGPDGNVWALKGTRGEDNKIYFREGVTADNPQGTGWFELPEGTTSRVVAGLNGAAWLLDKSGLLWHVPNYKALPSKDEWTRFDGETWADVSVAANGNIWALKGERGEDNKIYFREGVTQENPLGTNWRMLDKGTTSQVFAGSKDEAWFIDKSGLLWYVPHYKSSPYEEVNGLAKWQKFEGEKWADIAVAAPQPVQAAPAPVTTPADKAKERKKRVQKKRKHAKKKKKAKKGKKRAKKNAKKKKHKATKNKKAKKGKKAAKNKKKNAKKKHAKKGKK